MARAQHLPMPVEQPVTPVTIQHAVPRAPPTPDPPPPRSTVITGPPPAAGSSAAPAPHRTRSPLPIFDPLISLHLEVRPGETIRVDLDGRRLALLPPPLAERR